MLELIYTSRAIAEIDSGDIKDILRISQDHNAQKNITGCLLFYNHEFVQMLEGSEEEVVKLYERIEKDARHFDVRLLSMSNLSQRTFTSWSMAYQKLDDEDWSHLTIETDVSQIVSCSELVQKPSVAGIIFRSVATKMLSS